MSKPAMPRGGVMALHIKDKKGLYAAYMPFVRNGGLFIPNTARKFLLGDEVFLLLTLPDEAERFPITGKVVWITQRAKSAMRPAGIGIQFNDSPETQNVSRKIEALIAGMLESELPTQTM